MKIPFLSTSSAASGKTGLSFPRAVILFCSLGSVALGVMVYLRHTRLSEVHAELERVPGLIREIQTDAYRLDDLLRSAGTEKFKAQSEPLTYIQSIGAEKNTGMGQLRIVKTTRPQARGIEDSIYTITPDQPTQKYSRLQIANFLYRLEEDSPRVRVTRITMEPFERVKPGEIGRDQWKFTAELTTRSKEEGTSPDSGAGG